MTDSQIISIIITMGIIIYSMYLGYKKGMLWALQRGDKK